MSLQVTCKLYVSQQSHKRQKGEQFQPSPISGLPAGLGPPTITNICLTSIMALKPALKQLEKLVMDEDGLNELAVKDQFILVANILTRAAVRE
jgi:hypothetical protein